MFNYQKNKKLIYAALMMTLIIILGMLPAIPLGFIAVPIVLQNMGIMMSGSFLGPKYGTISVGGFLLLVMVGLPLLTGGRGGIQVLLGPTGGYMIAWLFVPLLIGISIKKLEQLKLNNFYLEFVFVIIFGVLFVDVSGSIWLSLQSNMPIDSALLSNLIFIPGDLIKAFLTVIISRRLRYKIGVIS